MQCWSSQMQDLDLDLDVQTAASRKDLIAALNDRDMAGRAAALKALDEYHDRDSKRCDRNSVRRLEDTCPIDGRSGIPDQS